MNIIKIVILLCSISFAQSYDDLTGQLKAAADPPAIHRLKAEVAEAAVQRLEEETFSKKERMRLRQEILACCSDVQLGAMDLWYGRSVVTWARLKLLDGQWKEARALLLEQAEVLQNIEKNLVANHVPVSSISPLAGCRYLLGETYRLEYEESQTLEPAVHALNHFYNVYIKYNDSPWGEAAREKAEAAKAFVEGQGRHVRIELGSHRQAFAAARYRLGVRFTHEEKYAAAIEPLIDAVNFFPASGETAQALRNLGVSYLHTDRDEEALMTAEYLCERFGGDTNAAMAVLGIGRQYIEAGENEPGGRIFNLYLAAFPEHPQRADVLSYFAWEAFKAETWPEAVRRFQALEAELRRRGETGERLEKAVYIQAIHPADPARLEAFTAEFPDSELVPSALAKKAQAQLVAGQFDAAFQTLEKLTDGFPEAPAARGALSGLIVAAVEAERFDIAGRVLDRMLADKKAYGYDVYLSTGDGLLAAGQFDLAGKAYSAVPLNAKQSFVERALYGTAAAQFGKDLFEESFQTLEKLRTKFPDSGRFAQARLMQARALVQLGRTEEAVAAYGDVLAQRQDYAVALELARILPDPEKQLAACQRIALLADPGRPENRPLIAESILASLPLCMELGKYQLAVENCDQFAGLFPGHEKLPAIGTFRKEAEDALAQ